MTITVHHNDDQSLWPIDTPVGTIVKGNGYPTTRSRQGGAGPLTSLSIVYAEAICIVVELVVVAVDALAALRVALFAFACRLAPELLTCAGRLNGSSESGMNASGRSTAGETTPTCVLLLVMSFADI